jgi:hypothetical protein
MSGLQMIVDRTSVNGKSCISFKQRTNEQNYVYVSDGSGCGSYVYFKFFVILKYYLKKKYFLGRHDRRKAIHKFINR